MEENLQFLRFLIECIIDGLNACVGKGSGTGKGIIGGVVLMVIAVVFGLSAFLLDRYTKLKHWQATLCAIAIVVVFILLFCTICIIIDH